jgi:ribosomal protein S18 acetylase RimI-like enzyme
MELAETRSVKQILLVSNPEAIVFWRKLGFEEKPDVEPCISYGEGAVTMKRTL